PLHHAGRLRVHGKGAFVVQPQERAQRHQRLAATDRPRARDRTGRMTCRPRPLVRVVLAGSAAFLLLAVAPLRAQRLPAVEAEHYTRCMEAARQTPQAAFDEANAWRIGGGGHPAEHCADVALIGLGRYAEAAGKLEA